MKGIAETATATRKFDSIILKYNNDKLEYFYHGGLSAANKILNRPLETKIEMVQADGSVILDESLSSKN